MNIAIVSLRIFIFSRGYAKVQSMDYGRVASQRGPQEDIYALCYIFCSFTTYINTFQHCQPVIYVDNTHLCRK